MGALLLNLKHPGYFFSPSADSHGLELTNISVTLGIEEMLEPSRTKSIPTVQASKQNISSPNTIKIPNFGPLSLLYCHYKPPGPGGTRFRTVRVCEARPPDPIPPSIRTSLKRTTPSIRGTVQHVHFFRPISIINQTLP